MTDIELHEQARHIKGYGFTPDEEKQCKSCPERTSERGHCMTNCRSRFHAGIRTATEKPVRVQVITTLNEYIDAINSIETTYAKPVFYRGQLRCSYTLLPCAYRSKENLKREDSLYREFERRFPAEMEHCTNAMERLEFMQHYEIPTRAMDITESPLIALYFACSPMIKYKKETGPDYYWGEVIPFRGDDDSIKYSDSSTVSVIANTGFCGEKFSLGYVQQKYMQEHPSVMPDFIYLKDILCRSVIVRTKQDNPRIKNQRGAFILVNANELINEDQFGEYFEERFNCSSIESFKNNIKNDGYLNLTQLKKQISSFKDADIWDFCFKKVEPYTLSNDPFDLEKLYYRNDREEQVVYLIPPCEKKYLKRQLQTLGFTEAFVYPELDSVAHELDENYLPERNTKNP